MEKTVLRTKDRTAEFLSRTLWLPHALLLLLWALRIPQTDVGADSQGAWGRTGLLVTVGLLFSALLGAFASRAGSSFRQASLVIVVVIGLMLLEDFLFFDRDWLICPRDASASICSPSFGDHLVALVGMQASLAAFTLTRFVVTNLVLRSSGKKER